MATVKQILPELKLDDAILKKKRVAAYARVSSLKDEQLNSYSNQISEYTKKILSNKDWDFAGVFADEGKSGTNTERREQFNSMIELSKLGSIDYILTKSVSRFGRNTLDTLRIIQDLRTINVDVYFENENLHSINPEIDFLLSVLSGMAEEESRSTSENVKWLFQRQYKEGRYRIANSILGYTYNNKGQLKIVEEEAKIIRLIFDKFASGDSTIKIIKYLNNNNIKTYTGKNKWARTSLLKILKNEKYCGDALLQKTYIPIIGSKRQKTNNGVLPKYYIEDDHEPIITRELFNKVQEILKQRSDYYIGDDKMKCTKKGPFAGMVYCSRCGKTYIKKQRNPGKINMLVCGNKRTDEGCTSEYVYYEAFEELIKTCINDLVLNKSEFLNKLEYQISTKIAESENDERITLVDSQIDEYEKKLKQLIIIDEIYGQKTIIDLKDKIANLKLERANLTNNYYLNKNHQNKCDKMKEFLNEIKEPIKSINDVDFKLLISNIKVIERDQFIFYIDCFNKKSHKHDSILGQALWSGNYIYQIRRLNFNMRYSIFLD